MIAQKAKPRLIPREHGAYGQLMLPLAAALALGRPTIASVCLVVAAVAVFFSHEALLVLIGKRGARVQREQGGRARRVGLGWVGLALASGGLGLWLGGKTVTTVAIIPLALAVPFTALVLRGREKSLIGELAAAATLTAASLPTIASVGLSFERSLIVWGAWAIGFAVSTCAVRWVIAAHKKRRAYVELFLGAVLTIAAALLMTRHAVLLASIPYLAGSWILIARPPSTRHLRRVGWTLIAAGVLTAGAVVLLVRLR